MFDIFKALKLGSMVYVNEKFVLLSFISIIINSKTNIKH